MERSLAVSQRAPLISYEQPQRERERSYNQPSDLWSLTLAFDELLPLSLLVRS